MFERWVPEVESAPEPDWAAWDRTQFERQLRYQHAKMMHEFRVGIEEYYS